MKLSTSLIIAISILVLDFATKRWVESELIYGQHIPFTNFFNLVLAFNAGAAFSFLSDESGWQRWLFSGISTCASVFDCLSSTKAYFRKIVLYRVKFDIRWCARKPMGSHNSWLCD